MFLLSGFVVGIFLDVAAAQIFMLAIAKEIFKIVGMTKEDKWTKVITIGLSFTVIITFAITPICHMLPILFMGIYSAIAQTVNWLRYMLIAIPVGLIIWVVMYYFLKLFVKPDVKKLQTIDFTKSKRSAPEIPPLPGPEGAVFPQKLFCKSIAVLVPSSHREGLNRCIDTA